MKLTNYRTAQAPVDGLDVETGMFTAPIERKYLVTLTAVLNTPYQARMSTYAQLFLRKNGKITSLDHYLLVEHGKVADMRTEVHLIMGDTLSVYVGHQVDRKHKFSSSGTVQMFDGFYLEDIKFCIF